ncbi:MAG TPA: hypothetical protein VJ843_04620 [Candidatus Saccharimonadales bacterium]|nr:hypothetical protein [Candidatus Saccharimonadales bacterium]
MTKVIDPRGKLASPWIFLRPALLFGLMAAGILLIVHYSNQTSCGDYGMAVMRILND